MRFFGLPLDTKAIYALALATMLGGAQHLSSSQTAQAATDPCQLLFSSRELDSPSVPLSEAQIQARLRGKVIVLAGAPGAGKGTQAQRLAKRFGLHHVSTGDLFRAEVRNQSEMGNTIAPIMKAGQLVPPEYTQAVLRNHLRTIDLSQGLLLDGVSRSLTDLAELEPVLKSFGLELDSVIHLQMTEEEAVERLSGRRVCPSCKTGFHLIAFPPKRPGICDQCGTSLETRVDDVESTIRERFRLYRSVSAPLEQELADRDLLYTVAGESSPDRTEARIIEALVAPERFHAPQSAYAKLSQKLLEARFEKDTPALRQLLTDFRDASLLENLAKRTGQMRKFVFLQTENPDKLAEFTFLFDRYGIEVLRLPPSNHPLLIPILLSLKSPELVPLAVLREQSRLLRPGSQQLSTLRSGVKTDHLSELQAFSLAPQGDVSIRTYAHRTEGRIVDPFANAGPQLGGAVPVFGWDDRFEVLATGKTYHQQRLQGLKVSSRDMVISQFMKDAVHYREPKNLAFNPPRVVRPVSFDSDLSLYFSSNPYYAAPILKNYGLDQMLTTVLNEGLFLKAPKTRIQANYWQPGLNAGLPLIQKKDPIHQSTFMFHDLGHFAIPDLIFSGEPGPRSREIYVAYRMMSEAITMFLADGLYVDSLAKNGIPYDYSRRKIYPLFLDLGLDFSGDLFALSLKRLLKANVDYVLRGDDSGFRALLEASGKGTGNLEAFKQKYSPFFVSDFEWTAHNFDHMSKNAAEIRRWWRRTERLREASGTRFETVAEFERGLGRSENDLIDSVFEKVFSERVLPALTGNAKLETAPVRARKAFFRYMIGQLGLLSRFESLPEMRSK